MLLFQLFLVSLFVLGVLAILRRMRSPDQTSSVELLIYFAALPLLMTALAIVGFGNIFIERSMLMMLPLFYGIVAIGVFTLPRWETRTIAVLALSAISVVALTSFYESRNEKWTVYKPNPDWRSAASYLGSEFIASDGDSMLLVGSPPDVLSYYDSRFCPVNLQRTGETISMVPTKPNLW